jgi:hypothetical protein
MVNICFFWYFQLLFKCLSSLGESIIDHDVFNITRPEQLLAVFHMFKKIPSEKYN